MTTATMTASPSTTTVAAVAPLVLTPPDVLAPVAPAQTKNVVQIGAERQAKIDQQLEGFLAALLNEDLRSDSFRQRLDQAFSIGRKEIAAATTMTNSFTSKDFVGEENTPAYKAIADMRQLFDSLNPAREGDLFSPTKVLGIPVPFGNKLARYLRRYESAGKQIGALHAHVLEAKDEVGKGVSELGLVRQQLWDALSNLQAVEYFITKLDERLSTQIESLRGTDLDRAKALEQEVLYYVRQNVGDVLATKALTINAYNVAGELRKTGREVINGCDRTATLGMAALSIAVTLARATGTQMKTMEMLAGSKKSIEDLITWTGTALNEHVQRTTEFASNPILGVETLQEMFNQTFQAMDTMDNFRNQALSSMKTNNDMLRGQLADQMKRISNERQVSAAADGIAL